MRAFMVVLMLMVVAAGCPRVFAAQQDQKPTPEFIKERVEELLSQAPFGTKREAHTYRYRWEEEDDYEPPDMDLSWLEGLLDWFAWVGWFASAVVWSLEVILWTLLIALVVLILVFYKRWLPYLHGHRQPPVPSLPSTLFGKEADIEPLPDDIVSEAWQCWLQGDARGCLSLLYRGALLRIILSRRLQLPDSATEEDCLRVIIPLESAECGQYFQSLTSWWQSTAYAARIPEQAQAETLVSGWREHFGEPA